MALGYGGGHPGRGRGENEAGIRRGDTCRVAPGVDRPGEDRSEAQRHAGHENRGRHSIGRRRAVAATQRSERRRRERRPAGPGPQRWQQRRKPCRPQAGLLGVHRRLRRRLGIPPAPGHAARVCSDHSAAGPLPHPDAAHVGERQHHAPTEREHHPPRSEEQQHDGCQSTDSGVHARGPADRRDATGVGGGGGDLVGGRRRRRLFRDVAEAVRVMAGRRKHRRLQLVLPDRHTGGAGRARTEDRAGLQLAVPGRSDLLHEQPGLLGR